MISLQVLKSHNHDHDFPFNLSLDLKHATGPKTWNLHLHLPLTPPSLPLPLSKCQSFTASFLSPASTLYNLWYIASLGYIFQTGQDVQSWRHTETKTSSTDQVSLDCALTLVTGHSRLDLGSLKNCRQKYKESVVKPKQRCLDKEEPPERTFHNI